MSPGAPVPPGFRAIWILRKLDPAAPAATYAVAAPADKAEPAGCTCPDHSINGAVCKHIMALRALTLIPSPKPTKPRPASNKARRLHKPVELEPEASRHLTSINSPYDPIYSQPEVAAEGFRGAIAAHVEGMRNGGPR